VPQLGCGFALTCLSQIMVHEVWYGINRALDFNSIHVHPASTVSGVLYLSTGNLSSSSLRLVDSTAHSSREHVLTVMAGSIVVFPSWLKHYVAAEEVGRNTMVTWHLCLKGCCFSLMGSELSCLSMPRWSMRNADPRGSQLQLHVHELKRLHVQTRGSLIAVN
jgi:hypothetical protein